MTTVNQIVRLDTSVPPNEVRAFKAAFPHIYEALAANQTIINQLIVRIGGSGSGSGVTDLDDLTAQVEDNERLNASPDAMIYALRQQVAELQMQVALLTSRIPNTENLERAVWLNVGG